MNKNLIQKIIPHIIVITSFLLLASIYFFPQFEGKVIKQGDMISHRGMTQEANDFKEKTGETTLWTNSIFGGMPTYQITTNRNGNILKHVNLFLRLYIPPPTGYFFAAMICFYILLLIMGVNNWLSMVGAIAFGFTSNHFILYEAGHMTKFMALAYSSLVIAGVIFAYRNKILLGGSLFALGFGLNLYCNHVQMTYYLGICLGIYVLVELGLAIKKKDGRNFLKASGVLLIGMVLGLGSSATNLWTSYEYSKDTMRGDPILESNTQKSPTNSSETKGLEWNYAMSWSNGALDLASCMIPGLVGGGSAEPVGEDSAIRQDLKRKGARLPKDFKAPLYWGSLPFTSGPAYFGAGICFLFILGLFLVRTPLKWWIAASVILTALISMGSHAEWLNRLLYDYAPFFNKFRAPNSILGVTAIFVVLLSILGLSEILDKKINKEEVLKALYISGGITGAICLFFALMGPSFFDFSSSGDARLESAGYSLSAIIEDRQNLMRSDSFRSLFIIAIFFGLIWVFLQEKIKIVHLIIGLGLVTIFDLGSIGKRYLNQNNFVSKKKYSENFNLRPVDKQILNDKDPNYRVLDLSINTFNSSSSSYYHKCIGGYHAAKLQRYQDIIDRHISKNNKKVLDMLNTKYIISQDQKAQQNPAALGNSWFVDTIRWVNSSNAEIDALNQFNPSTDVVVHDEYKSYLGNLNPNKNGTIRLTQYLPNKLTYESNSNTENLAVFSEIWYGPDKGWKVYIDGNPVEHIRANYLLRALKIPPGKHEIIFEFQPEKYYLGIKISLISSILIILLTGGGIFLYLKEKKETGL